MSAPTLPPKPAPTPNPAPTPKPAPTPESVPMPARVLPSKSTTAAHRQSENSDTGSGSTAVPDIVLRGNWGIHEIDDSHPTSIPTVDPLDPADQQQVATGPFPNHWRTRSSGALSSGSAWLADLRPSVVLTLLLLTATVLMVLDLRGGATHMFRSVGHGLGGPLQTWVSGVIGPIKETPLRRVDPSELNARVADLESQNVRLREELALANDSLTKSAQASALVGWGATNKFDVVPSRVVASGSGRAPGRLLTINSGQQDGLKADMAVVAQGALVGRLVDVALTSSTVQLVTDPGNRVWARLSKTRATLVAAGTGGGLEGLFVEPFAAVEAGDTLITMGSADSIPYPAGLPIATVTGVQGDLGQPGRLILANPIADLTSLDVVGVLTSPAKDVPVSPAKDGPVSPANPVPASPPKDGPVSPANTVPASPPNKEAP